MYESFFGLKNRPFLATPTLERYFPAECIEQAFHTVSRVIERGDGPVAILGRSGQGKSMLCLRIADAWRKNFEVILLSSSKLCTRRALLQSLLFELRMPFRDLTEGELRLSLMDRLQPSLENASDGLILIVDEAQTLSLKLLEELRLITNLIHQGQPRVRLVLAGAMRLEELLGHPSMESLQQRLAARCYLRNLTAAEVGRYVRHKVELCGVRVQEVFTDESIRSLHRASDGIPRLIDQIAEHAMHLAASQRVKPVSQSMIEQAWSSLQQLPAPWMETTKNNPVSNIVEFGSLEDDDDAEFECGAESCPMSNSTGSNFTGSNFTGSNFTGSNFTGQVPVPVDGLPVPALSSTPSPANPFADSPYRFIEVRAPVNKTQAPSEAKAPGKSTIEFDTAREQEDAALPESDPIPLESWRTTFAGPADFSNETFSIVTEVHTFDLDDDVTIHCYEPLVPIEPDALKIQYDPFASLPPFQELRLEEDSAKDPFGDDFIEEFPLSTRPESEEVRYFASIEQSLSSAPAPRVVSDAPCPIPIVEFEEELTISESTLENELREMITSLNISAAACDVVRDDSNNEADDSGCPPAMPEAMVPSDLVQQAFRRGDVLSFATVDQRRVGIQGDDRDLVVVEDDIQADLRAAQSVVQRGTETPAPSSAPQNYIQLFSKLRG
jgi:type II secretory pathway predicted ATPase ExeA